MRVGKLSLLKDVDTICSATTIQQQQIISETDKRDAEKWRNFLRGAGKIGLSQEDIINILGLPKETKNNG